MSLLSELPAAHAVHRRGDDDFADGPGAPVLVLPDERPAPASPQRRHAGPGHIPLLGHRVLSSSRRPVRPRNEERGRRSPQGRLPAGSQEQRQPGVLKKRPAVVGGGGGGGFGLSPGSQWRAFLALPCV